MFLWIIGAVALLIFTVYQLKKHPPESRAKGKPVARIMLANNGTTTVLYEYADKAEAESECARFTRIAVETGNGNTFKVVSIKSIYARVAERHTLGT
jgi:hypothetical protein